MPTYRLRLGQSRIFLVSILSAMDQSAAIADGGLDNRRDGHARKGLSKSVWRLLEELK